MTAGNGHGQVMAGRTKLLTFESWVTRATWYDYALAHPEVIPFLLIDRSPCQDPFFDPFAAPADRRPMISGLCRGRAMRNFRVGDCFIYITRVDPRIVRRFASDAVTGPRYFAVAVLRVVHVWPSHEVAAANFAPRRYVSVPERTPYPPNLAFAHHPEAAAASACSIVHDVDNRNRAHVPDDATDRMWRRQYSAYRTRQIRSQLPAAECRIETVHGRPSLQLRPARAPIVTPAWWGGAQMNVMGQWVPEKIAHRFRAAIAGASEADG
jgi:hypothetical protein